MSTLTSDQLEQAREICADFAAENAEIIARLNLTSDDVGHDLWLTQNRHGAGFWDRGLGADGDVLTQRAHPYGEMNVMPLDDGTLVIEG